MTPESNEYGPDHNPLSADQIAQLIDQGCSCDDWSKVTVTAGFRAETVHATRFSGAVKLGTFEKQVSLCGGVSRPTGISHATIHNCTIGDNVYITRVGNHIANYVIEDDVVIENIDLLAVEGPSSFGNGVEIAVVNEAGGREISIYDGLSAQKAYVMAFYRHRPILIEKLRQMVADYTASVTSSTGLVGRGARIMNCRIMKNIKLGPAGVLEAVNKLENGSINSCPEDPVYIGPGVFAEHFIACSGSRITDGTIIYKCFIGQGTVLSRQYSAENSVFFANCGGHHGEACAVFAGPYTVTHHKSTLLIAGLFSFLNAGSGTNQSNHMYKFGPVHQGVIERGSKTASDSYILWPAKVGAFTVVMGRHYRNSDTSDLPFSYLIEHEDESILVPGVNLRSVGTIRDARKWPTRDRRKAPDKLDCINFRLLSPYTVQKMLNGSALLAKLKETSGETSEYFTYNSVKIKGTSLVKGLKLYKLGIDKFLGNCLIKHLEGKYPRNVEELREMLKPQTDTGPGRWVDLAGMFAPEKAVEKVLCRIEDGTLQTMDQVSEVFQSVHRDYPEYEWAWVTNVLQQRLGKTLDCITADDIIKLATDWKHAVTELDNMLCTDARKEFAATVQTGYGLDGNQQTRRADFERVRGTFDENDFVQEIEKHIVNKTALGDELIGRMERLRDVAH
jgi:carbonic anhydrase/acetyltransferase-like protein (isoleucine patch superfamily)